MKKLIAIGGGEIGRPGYSIETTKIEKEMNIKLKYIENLLNNRPRKCLNYLTPNESFDLSMCSSEE